MALNIKHVLFIALAAAGLLYVFHMMSTHQGTAILPGLGLPSVGGK